MRTVLKSRAGILKMRVHPIELRKQAATYQSNGCSVDVGEWEPMSYKLSFSSLLEPAMVRMRRAANLTPINMDPQGRRVRVVVDGSTKAGREILRGVILYARAHTRWSLVPYMDMGLPRGEDWAEDDATLYASHFSGPLQEILPRGRPVVGALSHHKTTGIPIVCGDDFAVGELAAEYFLERGFEHFVFAGGGDPSQAAHQRRDGFNHGIRQRGFSARSCDLPDADDTSEQYLDELTTILPTLPKPMAILLGHDALGQSVINTLTGLGLAVPKQVAVLGVDNDELHCETCSPPLSSIEIPYAQVGRQAAALLHAVLNNEPLPEIRLIPPAQVITGQSTDVVAIGEPRLAEAFRYMREHACDPCGVEDVLNHVLVGRRWLEQQFLARFGRTPRDEIVRVRIERAKHLLRDPQLSLETIADRSGYKQVQNLICAFRKTVGQTPAAYRRNLLGDAPHRTRQHGF